MILPPQTDCSKRRRFRSGFRAHAECDLMPSSLLAGQQVLSLGRVEACRRKWHGLNDRATAPIHVLPVVVLLTSRFLISQYCRGLPMRTRRQFQPMIDGLPYRIAPSSMAVAPATSLIAMARRGQSSLADHGAFRLRHARNRHIDPGHLAGPPPAGGDGTLVC